MILWFVFCHLSTIGCSSNLVLILQPKIIVKHLVLAPYNNRLLFRIFLHIWNVDLLGHYNLQQSIVFPRFLHLTGFGNLLGMWNLEYHNQLQIQFLILASNIIRVLNFYALSCFYLYTSSLPILTILRWASDDRPMQQSATSVPSMWLFCDLFILYLQSESLTINYLL